MLISRNHTGFSHLNTHRVHTALKSFGLIANDGPERDAEAIFLVSRNRFSYMSTERADITRFGTKNRMKMLKNRNIVK